MPTRKPTDNALEIAIVAAEQELATGRDEHHIASTLLYLYERMQDLEQVSAAAEHLLQAGQDREALAALAGAVERTLANEARRCED